jgi:hypothetical protein
MAASLVVVSVLLMVATLAGKKAVKTVVLKVLSMVVVWVASTADKMDETLVDEKAALKVVLLVLLWVVVLVVLMVDP